MYTVWRPDTCIVFRVWRLIAFKEKEIGLAFTGGYMSIKIISYLLLSMSDSFIKTWLRTSNGLGWSQKTDVRRCCVEWLKLFKSNLKSHSSLFQIEKQILQQNLRGVEILKYMRKRTPNRMFKTVRSFHIFVSQVYLLAVRPVQKKGRAKERERV